MHPHIQRFSHSRSCCISVWMVNGWLIRHMALWEEPIWPSSSIIHTHALTECFHAFSRGSDTSTPFYPTGDGSFFNNPPIISLPTISHISGEADRFEDLPLPEFNRFSPGSPGFTLSPQKYCNVKRVGLQVEDQVVESLLWDAVVQPHCGGKTRRRSLKSPVCCTNRELSAKLLCSKQIFLNIL